MIRESNTLTWQETAEKECGDEKERCGESAGCCCYLAVS